MGIGDRDPAANVVLLPGSHEARAAVAEIVAAAIAADAVVASAREVLQRSYEPPLSVETGQRLNAHTVICRQIDGLMGVLASRPWKRLEKNLQKRVRAIGVCFFSSNRPSLTTARGEHRPPPRRHHPFRCRV